MVGKRKLVDAEGAPLEFGRRSQSPMTLRSSASHPDRASSSYLDCARVAITPDPTAQPGPISQPATTTSLPARLRAVYADRIGPSERALLYSWSAFAATFGATRLITHRLRRRGGSGGIVIRGRHIHHYNFGIALLVGVGGIGVHGQEHARRHAITASAYGSGVALIVDELALLLDLEDVYWANDGRTSVDVAVGTIALGGIFFAAAPFWKSVAREIARTRRLV
jgi:hypothetical protein